jgi:hypothetical protein
VLIRRGKRDVLCDAYAGRLWPVIMAITPVLPPSLHPRQTATFLACLKTVLPANPEQWSPLKPTTKERSKEERKRSGRERERSESAFVKDACVTVTLRKRWDSKRQASTCAR